MILRRRRKPPEEFVFVVKTDNAGVSGSNQFRLPLVGTGMNFSIAWGDGTFDRITTSTQPEITHTYPSAGTYAARCTGIVRGWQFIGIRDCLKFIEVQKCGAFFFNQIGVFEGCSNMIWSATDIPKIEATTFQGNFRLCSLFNADMSSWPMFNVLSYNNAFSGCTNLNTANIPINAPTVLFNTFLNAVNFNQDISYINFSNVTSMSGFMTGKTHLNYSAANYDALLISLASQSLQTGVTLNMGTIKYTAAASAARAFIISTYGWTITDGGLI